jgi:hypothetical protein
MLWIKKNSQSRKFIFPCNTRKKFVNLTVYYMETVMLKRDIQGKFALKNDDYRQVRSLRLTDDTWKALGIVAECNRLSLFHDSRQKKRINPQIVHHKKRNQ